MWLLAVYIFHGEIFFFRKDRTFGKWNDKLKKKSPDQNDNLESFQQFDIHFAPLRMSRFVRGEQ